MATASVAKTTTVVAMAAALETPTMLTTRMTNDATIVATMAKMLETTAPMAKRWQSEDDGHGEGEREHGEDDDGDADCSGADDAHDTDEGDDDGDRACSAPTWLRTMRIQRAKCQQRTKAMPRDYHAGRPRLATGTCCSAKRARQPWSRNSAAEDIRAGTWPWRRAPCPLRTCPRWRRSPSSPAPSALSSRRSTRPSSHSSPTASVHARRPS